MKINPRTPTPNGLLPVGEVTSVAADCRPGKREVQALLAERYLRQGAVSYVNGKIVRSMDDIAAIREGRF